MTVYILGLDGLDLQLVERSKMSRILEKQGLGGKGLESVTPPITVPAWACSFSGLTPDRLECFDFQSLDLEERRFVPVNRERFNAYGYWNYTQKSSALFDVPGADRPDLDGCFVGGIFDFGEMVTKPVDLSKRIRESLGRPELQNMEDLDSEAERLAEARRIFGFRADVLNWLVGNTDEDVYFSVFRLPDTTMHHTDSPEEMTRSYDVVAEFLDEFLEKNVSEEDDVLIVSDHGAVKFDREFHINSWLEREGFLKQEGKDSSIIEDLVFRVADLGRRLGLRDLLVRFNEISKKTVDADFSPGKSEVMESLDWDETEAFAYVTGVCAYGGIWINDGRLGGVVNDVEGKKTEIAGKLRDREEVVWVKDSADVYTNPSEGFPSLVVSLRERTKFESSLHPKIVSEVCGFMHRKQGFVASNRELRDEPELVDLATTVLHLLGDTAPEHMDGESMLKSEVKEESKETSGIDF